VDKLIKESKQEKSVMDEFLAEDKELQIE